MAEDKPRNLRDAREQFKEKNREKVRKLFEDHPEIAEDAIIISPGSGVMLTPEGIGNAQIVSALEMLKTMILLDMIKAEL